MFRSTNTVMAGFFALVWLAGCDAKAPEVDPATPAEQTLKESSWISESNTHHLEFLDTRFILTTFDEGADSVTVLSGSALDSRRILVEEQGSPALMGELDEEAGRLIVTALGTPEKMIFERLGRHSVDQLLGHWHSAYEAETDVISMREGQWDLRIIKFDHEKKNYAIDEATTHGYKFLNGNKLVTTGVESGDGEEFDDSVIYIVDLDQNQITYVDNWSTRWTEKRFSGDIADLVPDGYTQVPLPKESNNQ